MYTYYYANKTKWYTIFKRKNNMQILYKTFQQLTTQELYQIYKARVDVFVVEQNCPYHEIDDYDPLSIHVMGFENNTLVSYLRVLPPHTTFETASIGRVLSIVRHKHYAQTLLKVGMKLAKDFFHADTITIEAQTYARSLYESQGFIQASQPFLEDGIEHIQMQYKTPLQNTNKEHN